MGRAYKPAAAPMPSQYPGYVYIANYYNLNLEYCVCSIIISKLHSIRSSASSLVHIATPIIQFPHVTLITAQGL